MASIDGINDSLTLSFAALLHIMYQRSTPEGALASLLRVARRLRYPALSLFWRGTLLPVLHVRDPSVLLTQADPGALGTSRSGQLPTVPEVVLCVMPLGFCPQILLVLLFCFVTF